MIIYDQIDNHVTKNAFMTPICNNLDGVILSLQACMNLGIVGPEFPQLALKSDATSTRLLEEKLEDTKNKLEEKTKMLEEVTKKLEDVTKKLMEKEEKAEGI